MKNKNNPSKRKKVKKKYKVRNWREYNEALVNRGDIKLLLDEKTIETWHDAKGYGLRGRPRKFSDVAIQTVVAIQQVFHLSLRQAEGLTRSIFSSMALELSVPDYSTVSLRMGKLKIKLPRLRHRNERLYVVVDSSGVKVYGEGEWKVRQHGWSKHRTWRKMHLALNAENGIIEGARVTGNNIADSQVVGSLLQQIRPPIDKCAGDGGYDRRSCYQVLAQRGIQANIPPQHNAKIWQHGNSDAPPLARDENLRRIREIGRKNWKVECGYHQRSLAENGMYRMKTIFGERISARTEANQTAQILIRCRVLNQMTKLGMPDSYVVE